MNAALALAMRERLGWFPDGNLRQLAIRAAVTAAAALWLFPALLSLANRTWQSEAGSIAPLLLCLGGWVLWNAYREHSTMARPGPHIACLIAFVPISLIYLFASAIDMTALLALSAWAGAVIAFLAWNGWPLTKKCLFPLLFLGMAVPLPYSLTLTGNMILRNWLADTAGSLGSALGMDIAIERDNLIVDQYILAVVNACAGLSSTFSLVAVGLLFAYLVRDGSKWRPVAAVALAVPIAMAANILRVVFLLAAVRMFGTDILDTMLHPISGLISFSLTLGLSFTIDRLIVAATDSGAKQRL